MAHRLRTGTTQGAVGLTPPDFGVGEGVVAVIVIDETVGPRRSLPFVNIQRPGRDCLQALRDSGITIRVAERPVQSPAGVNVPLPQAGELFEAPGPGK